MIPRIAWRNIWRNKRRTLLTAASIFLAVFLALLVRSIQTGWFDHLINVVIQSYTGHIQLHKKGYWDDKDINNSMECNDSLIRVLKSTENVVNVIPRLEYFALSSYLQQTKGVLLIGTDPAKEDEMTHLSGKVIKGKYLESSGNGVLVAQGLAGFLRIVPGDTLVLIGQGYHGSTAAGKYPVVGLVHFPSPQMDNQMVYLNLKTAQEFYSADNRITSVAVVLKNPDYIARTNSILKERIGDKKYEIMNWDEMLVEVMQQMKVKIGGGKIITAMLYMIVGFGIFGTVIMMTNERLKEFGVVVSVGMQKARLAWVFLMEMLLMGFLGIAGGVIAALPLMIWYHIHPIRLWGNMAQTFINYGIEPIMPLSVQPGIILSNTITVLVIICITCIYSVQKIFRLKVVEALRK